MKAYFAGNSLIAILVIAVSITVFAVHLPTLSAKAIFLDDQMYLLDNPLVQNPSWTSVKRFLTEVLEPSTVEGYYQPLAMISLMVDYAAGGRENNLLPFRITSLALHTANTALIVVLLYLLFGNIWAASAAGLLFGVHPITVESIAWLSERKTVLATFFALWSLILYVRYARNGNRKFYFGCLLMYLLALMSKPTSVPLPAVMVLMDYWPLKRLSVKTFLDKIHLFAIGGIFAVITYISQHRTSVTISPIEYGAMHVLLVLCHNIVFYLYKIILPLNLSFFYAFPKPFGLSNTMVLVGVIGTCVLIPLLICSLRWTRAAFTGWLIFFVAIFPAIGVVGFTNVIAADRFAYLPFLGLLMAVTAFLIWVSKKTKIKILVLIVLLLAGTEAFATQRYLSYWQNSTCLYEYMLAQTPDAVLLRNNFGVVLGRQGRFDEAVAQFNEVFRLEPNFADTYYNLGYVLLCQNKFDQAVTQLERAVQLDPDFEKSQYYLAIALRSKGRFNEAVTHYQAALKLKPDWIEPMNSLAWLLAIHRDAVFYNPQKAVQLAQRACELTAYKNAGILDTLAVAYAAAGNFPEAVAAAVNALNIARAEGNNQLAAQIRRRLDLFKTGQPYTELAQNKRHEN